jgi:hypothetical protein
MPRATRKGYSDCGISRFRLRLLPWTTGSSVYGWPQPVSRRPAAMAETQERHSRVKDSPPGMTFWRVKNGIRLTGMPP